MDEYLDFFDMPVSDDYDFDVIDDLDQFMIDSKFDDRRIFSSAYMVLLKEKGEALLVSCNSGHEDVKCEIEEAKCKLEVATFIEKLWRSER